MDYKITPKLLREVAGAPTNKKVVEHIAQYLPEIADEYNINTRNRLAHFLAQICHESDHFRTTEEYASGSAYEGRRDLGNVKRGDGRRYKGRGVIQLTGRYNYRKYGALLGVDLEGNPELAATPEISIRLAAEYWRQTGLNEWADKDNGKQITRKINGGYNGLQSRLDMVERAKRALDASLEEDNEPAPKIVKPVVKPKPTVTPVPVVEATPEPIPEPIVDTTLPIFAQLTLDDKPTQG